MSNCKIHNVRFYRPEPKAIFCTALHRKNKKLALSRSDASIEIWNLNKCCFIERTIASTVENFSIEGLAWCKDTLYSVGLHGMLVEYNLEQLCVKESRPVTGEAAFCLDVNKNETEIAVATEKGYLNIFKVLDDGVYFEKFLDKQEGRILCLKYDHTGDFIVSGGLDAIRIWNVKTGHAIHKMTTGRSEAKKPTIIWCLGVTENFTIISGDSRGKLTFWDGSVGAQIESYQSHRADILTLCLSDDEESLYCAGIDPTITNYTCITVKDGTKKWVKSVQRKIHDHDIRSLITCEDKLYSCGSDGYISCTNSLKMLLKYPPIMQNPCTSLANKARYIMLRYPKKVEIWSIGSYENENTNRFGLLNIKSEPKKLVVLQKIVKDDEGKDKKEGIICSAISNNGEYLAYSSKSGVRLFQMQSEENVTSRLLPIQNFEKEVPCVCAVFSPDSSQFIIAPATGNIEIYTIRNDLIVNKECIETKEMQDTITFLKISWCGKYLIAADPLSNIAIWCMNKSSWSFYAKLPKYKVSPTALSVHPNTSNLVVVYADNKIVEYDVKKREFTRFSRSLEQNLPKVWLQRTYAIRNITFDPRVPNIILLHDDNTIFVLDKEKESLESSAKVPKLDSNETGGNKNKKIKGNTNIFRSIKKYKHLVDLAWLDNDELVAVEVSPLSLVEQLPPCLFTKKFGRK